MNMGPAIARKLEQKPEFLDEALRTLERWRGLGNIPEPRAAQWQALLAAARGSRAGFRRVLRILRSRREADRRLRDFAPFAGILTREERRKVFLKCVYSHCSRSSKR